MSPSVRHCWTLFTAVSGLLLVGEAAVAEVNQWTSRGPLGAQLRAVAVGPPQRLTFTEPEQAFTLYVATHRRVFRSADEGATWTPIFESTQSIATFDADPVTPDVLYAGVANVGIFKTTDGGRSWNRLDGPGAIGCCVKAFAIDPTDPSTLYAADGYELLRSTDGGDSWAPIGSGLPAVCCVRALAVDPQTPSTLYAGTSFGGPLFKSSDGGNTWSEVATSLTDDVDALAIDPEDPTKLYAGVGFTELFESADGGANWSAVGIPPTGGIADLAIDVLDPGALYAASASGLYRSLDGGGTWSNLVDQGLSPARIAAFAVDPAAPDTLYAAAIGVFKSTDGGATWVASSAGLTDLWVLSMAIDPQMPSTLYAGTVLGGVFKSVDGAASWNAANVGRQSSATDLVIDPQNPSTLYSTGLSGYLYKSVDGATSWTRLTAAPGGLDAVAVDPQNPDVLYAGSDSLYGTIHKSVDGGASWTALDTGFESARVIALTVDPVTPATVYAGTSLYGVNTLLRSADGGASWQPSGAGIPAEFSVRAVLVDPTQPSTVYAGISGSHAVYRGGVSRSLDGGATWSDWNRGIPASHVSALALDPTNPARLWAGSSAGVADITAVPMSIGDFVWVDEDRDGIQDPGEPGLEGTRVSVIENERGVYEQITTRDDGAFLFDWLPPGNYTLDVHLPVTYEFRLESAKALPPTPVPLYFFSPRDQGGDDTRDSDVDTQTGETSIVVLAVGDNDPTIDAGAIPVGIFSDGFESGDTSVWMP